MDESRKLAIIVFADIAGYSAMMQRDEQKALHILDLFKAILEEQMALHEGKIVQYYGDGSLLAFDSALHSVQAAMALQTAFIAQGVPVRIGLHLGDILYRNQNVFGDGVNVASRVESLGVPGAILLSRTVRNQIQNKAEISLHSLGEFHFKNIVEPVEVFAISNPGFAIPTPSEMEGKLETKAPKPPLRADSPEMERYQMLEILDSLEAEKCVLILGNYAFSRPNPEADGPEAESELFLPDLVMREQQKWQPDHPAADIADFYSAAQALIDRAGGRRLFMELTEIKYPELRQKQRDRFRRLSEIPFDLILSTYPFDLLHEVFAHNQIAHQYQAYSYLQEPVPLASFSAEKPLLYNLFGSTRHKESMVITLDRLYQFIFGVLGVRPLPKLIQDKVQQASHLVFLGFAFDDWYMKLLLRVLKVHEKDISYAHPPGQAGLQQQNRRFFESNFKVTFLDKKVDEFIRSLHEHCEDSGILRGKSPEADYSLFQRLPGLLEQNRLEEILEQLDERFLQDDRSGSLIKDLGYFQQAYHQLQSSALYERYSQAELAQKWREYKAALSGFIDHASKHLSALI